MYEFSTLGWVRHVVFHPFEGFEDLRWKKQGSLKVALILVVMLFIAMVANNRMVGFAFNTNTVKVFNVVPLIVQSVVYFATWVIGNWCICFKEDLHLLGIRAGTLHNLQLHRSICL